MKNKLLILGEDQLLVEEIADFFEDNFDSYRILTSEEAYDFMESVGNEISSAVIFEEAEEYDAWDVVSVLTDEENGWPDLNITIIGTEKLSIDLSFRCWQLGRVDYLGTPFFLERLANIVGLQLIRA